MDAAVTLTNIVSDIYMQVLCDNLNIKSYEKVQFEIHSALCLGIINRTHLPKLVPSKEEIIKSIVKRQLAPLKQNFDN